MNNIERYNDETSRMICEAMQEMKQEERASFMDRFRERLAIMRTEFNPLNLGDAIQAYMSLAEEVRNEAYDAKIRRAAFEWTMNPQAADQPITPEQWEELKREDWLKRHISQN